MAMRLSANINIGIRTFNDLCRRLGFNTVPVDKEHYCATINQELFDYYWDKAEELEERSNTLYSRTEKDWLWGWSIIWAAHIDNCCKNHSSDWEDLYFC